MRLTEVQMDWDEMIFCWDLKSWILLSSSVEPEGVQIYLDINFIQLHIFSMSTFFGSNKMI